MIQEFNYGQYNYEYFVEFDERKSLAIEIRPDMRIIVKAPTGISLDEIEDFLERKWRWLDKNLAEVKKLYKSHHKREYISGESYYYLGRQYLLLVEKGADVVKLERGKLRICTTKDLRDSKHNQKLLDDWYARRRNFIFKQEFLAALKLFDFGVIPRLGVRSMQKRWGSHKADGQILLNPRLIEAPREAIYYVCVHELCHRISLKHDKLFYEEMNKRLPGWRKVKQSLELRFG